MSVRGAWSGGFGVFELPCCGAYLGPELCLEVGKVVLGERKGIVRLV